MNQNSPMQGQGKISHAELRWKISVSAEAQTKTVRGCLRSYRYGPQLPKLGCRYRFRRVRGQLKLDWSRAWIETREHLWSVRHRLPTLGLFPLLPLLIDDASIKWEGSIK